jgi:hypothetical protein
MDILFAVDVDLKEPVKAMFSIYSVASSAPMLLQPHQPIWFGIIRHVSGVRYISSFAGSSSYYLLITKVLSDLVA